MEIYEKIDFLMKITGSKNSDLGKAVAFDPSYISKIRSGNRSVPKNPEFTKSIATFFAKNIKDDYQLEAVSHLVLPSGTLSSDKKELTASICKFLGESGTGKESDDQVYRLLTDMTNIFAPVSHAPVIPEFKAVETTSQDEGSIVPISVFYGNQGKREAVKKFLSYLISQKKPFILHLYSDEDMTWLYESPDFAKEWALMLIQLVKTGSKIQIIHTISRDLSELMEAIRKWLPIYSTGAIEPYFCPKLRDGIYNRSLFIAKGTEALISTSVDNKTEGMANFLIRKDEVVEALEFEYQNYFSLCKPLMQMYSAANKDAFIGVLAKPKALSGKFFLVSPVPSLWTTPIDLARKIAKSTENDSILKIVESLKANMIKILEDGGEITEILTITDPDYFKDKKHSIPMGDMYGSSAYAYDNFDLKQHLEEVSDLTAKYPGYRFIISDVMPSSIMLLSHSDSETIISNSASPTIAFVISHQQFSYAFYEYTTRIEKESALRRTMSIEEYTSSL